MSTMLILAKKITWFFLYVVLWCGVNWHFLENTSYSKDVHFSHYAFNTIWSFLRLKECPTMRGAGLASYAINDFITDLITDVACDFFLSVFFLRRPPSGSAFSLSVSSFYALVDFMLSVRIWRMLRMRPTSQTLLARERAKSNYTVRFPRIKYSRYTVTRIHFSTFWSEHSVRSETKLSKWNWRNLSLKKE